MGIPYNGSLVTPFIIRGPYPTGEQVASLNLKHVLMLMDDDESIKVEGNLCLALNIDFVSIPMSGVLKPALANLVHSAWLLNIWNQKEERSLVHCLHGCDRTGWVVAAYRMIYQHWSYDQAYEEALKMGHSKFPMDYWPLNWTTVLKEIQI